MSQKEQEILKQPVTDRSAWRVADLEGDKSWIYELAVQALSEIDDALASVKQRGIPLYDIKKADFELPTLGATLSQAAEELENGRGIVVLRRVPVEKYSVEDARIVIWGIGTHWGEAISQNARGERLCSVMDQGREYGALGRGYQTSARLDFHSDNADVAALLFLTKAKRGATSLVTSATSIYNELLKNHPEYLDTLYRGFLWGLRGEGGEGAPEFSDHLIPLYSYFAGKLSARFGRNGIELGSAASNQPLSERDVELLDYLDELALRPDLCFQDEFGPGDIQVVNNHTILHARTDYEDYPEPERRRHALRLWINLYKGRPLKKEFSQRYGPRSGRLGVPPVEHPPEHLAVS